MIRFFNKVSDKIKLFDHYDKVKKGLESLVVLPTHSHYLGTVLALEAAAMPNLSKKAQKWLTDGSNLIVTPKYLALCYPSNDKNKSDIGTELIKDLGKDIEAMQAIIWATKQKTNWKLWREKMKLTFSPHYPEIPESEW